MNDLQLIGTPIETAEQHTGPPMGRPMKPTEPHIEQGNCATRGPQGGGLEPMGSAKNIHCGSRARPLRSALESIEPCIEQAGKFVGLCNGNVLGCLDL